VEQSVEWELAGEVEILVRNLPQCHVAQHKSHMIWPGLEPGPKVYWIRRLKLLSEVMRSPVQDVGYGIAWCSVTAICCRAYNFSWNFRADVVILKLRVQQKTEKNGRQNRPQLLIRVFLWGCLCKEITSIPWISFCWCLLRVSGHCFLTEWTPENSRYVCKGLICTCGSLEPES
jgi:hypothetical protein